MTEHQTEEFIGGASFSRLFEEMYDPALLFQVDTGTILFANSAARRFLSTTNLKSRQSRPADP